jgi:RND family efflux transporter MFP subunit
MRQRDNAVTRALAPLCLAASALMLMTTVGCSRPSTASPPGPTAAAGPAAPTPVTIVKPERKTVRRTIGQPGQIEAFQQTPIFAKIPGFVQKVRVDIGDRVKAGDELAVLWVPEMDEELKQKQALVVQAAAEVAQAEKNHEAAVAHVQYAAATVERWRSEFERLDRVLKDGKVIDKQTVEETRFQWQASKAGLDEATAKRDKAQADVRVAKARVQVAEADARRMAALVDYARIRAPYDGVVTRRYIDEGHFIQPAAAGAKGEPLYVVMQADPVRIFVDVPETDVSRVSDGMPARIRIQALQGKEFDGKVTRSSFAVDPRTRTLRTEIDVPNPRGVLRPGLYAYVSIKLEHANAWTLPASALVIQGDDAYCYRVENGKAVRTPLRLGLREGALAELLQKRTGADKWEDVTGVEEIVQTNPAALTDGQPVAISSK